MTPDAADLRNEESCCKWSVEVTVTFEFYAANVYVGHKLSDGADPFLVAVEFGGIAL
jgi:hypothetical protein